MSETSTEAAPEPQAEAPADDLRSALGSAWDEHSPADAERDDRGRFASAEPTEPEVAEPVEAAPAPEPEPIAPPATLADDERLKWATLPRDAQEMLAAREAKAQEATRTAEPVNEVLRKYEPLYAARGITASQAMVSLFEAQRMLETRPAEAIAVLARQYGVPLNQAQAPTANPNDPMQAVMQEVQSLRATIAERDQAAEQSARQAIESNIQNFASDPKHSHFPAVRVAMGALMQAGIAQDMAGAYEMACRAHPEVSKALDAERAKTEAQTRAKAAQEARAKAVSVRGSPPINGNGAPPDTLRGALEAAWGGAIH